MDSPSCLLSGPSLENALHPRGVLAIAVGPFLKARGHERNVQLGRHVVTVERVLALAETARGRMAALGYPNVIVRQAVEDQLGWPEDAPYDAIVVTAAAPGVPPSLLAQLRDGGRLVIPGGSRDEQALLQVVKGKDGTVSSRHITYCRFVPLLGVDGWPVEAGAGA